MPPKRKYIRKCPKSSKAIGLLGECFVTEILTDALDCEVLPYGGNVKSFDLLCVMYEKSSAYAFMVQVKTQYKGRYTKDKKSINTKVPDEKLEWLINLPLPTYIASVDYDKDIMYLAPAFDKSVKYKVVPIKYQFMRKNYPHSVILKDEVKKYWDSIKIKVHKSSFKSIFS